MSKPESKGFAYTSIDQEHYIGRSLQSNGILTDKLFRIPAVHFDNVVIERLKVLADKDRNIANKVKVTLEQVYHQQSDDFVSIHEQLKGIEIQLLENAEKRLMTSNKDPLYARLQAQAVELLLTKT